ncbi:SDR family oxidoreductase [Solibacillus sp. FSL H8-0538]|uniref:SDR family oxidoreductase n=1 Tax=Solibacillus sp. FSL H8-0538 TaxID=2921400 RepID=UPI0030F5BF34
MRLQDKVAVVTGAASGMGKAIAILYAQEGAKVVVSDLTLEGAGATVSEITALGGTATAVVANVANEGDIHKLIKAALNSYGTIDILVNNAGIMDDFSPIGDVTDDMWDRVFEVNVKGVMRATRQAMPIFLEKGAGVIVNIASIGGLYGSRAGASYTAAKHAVVGLTKNTAFQYAGKGIRCNAIAPGGVNTNITASLKEPNEFGISRAMAGVGFNPRNGEPEDIAKVALFLASDDSDFVNGIIVTADAGWTAY